MLTWYVWCVHMRMCVHVTCDVCFVCVLCGECVHVPVSVCVCVCVFVCCVCVSVRACTCSATHAGRALPSGLEEGGPGSTLPQRMKKKNALQAALSSRGRSGDRTPRPARGLQMQEGVSVWLYLFPEQVTVPEHAFSPPTQCSLHFSD